MRRHILAEPSPSSPRWLTTADVARMLEVTVHGVRWLARTGAIAFERTTSGQRIFRRDDVLRVLERRAMRRWVGALPVTEPIGEPRQLSLFGKARLRLVERV